MTDHTAAARQRRSRAHKSGNHTLCLPERCKLAAAADSVDDGVAEVLVDEPAAAASTPTVVEQLGPRGRQLWDDMSGLINLGPAHRVLLLEACRIADRLDRLDRMLDNRDDWIRSTVLDLGSAQHIRITVDGMLAEARQQAIALRGLVGELRQAAATVKAPAPPAAAAAAPGEPAKGVGSVGDLVSRIAAARSR